jgi:hypothetical protein
MWLGACGCLLALPGVLPSDSEPPALAPLTHGYPLTALAGRSGVRLDKPAQPPRTSIKRPEMGGRLPRPGTIHTVRPTTVSRQPFWDLPRHHLVAVWTSRRSSGDSAEPFPS